MEGKYRNVFNTNGKQKNLDTRVWFYLGYILTLVISVRDEDHLLLR